MNARKTVTGTPSRWVTATALVLAYGLALWTLWLQHASGLHQHGGPSLPLHWLRDATVTAVQVVVAVRLTVQVADRLLRADRTHLGALLCGAVAASIAYAAWLPVRETLFPTHAAASLPLAVQVLRDSLVGLVVAVPAVLLLHTLFVAQPWRSRRLISANALRRTVARVAVAVMAVASFATSPLLANAASASEATPWDGNPCPGSASARSFEITAVDVKIPLNRYGDNDPQGKMYVATKVDGVENKLTAPGDTAKPALEAVRAQEASQKVSIGLRDDPIQPLSIRANEGDCVSITYTNQATGGDFGLHIDGLAFASGSSGDRVGNNSDSSAKLNSGPQTYTYWIPKNRNLEGSHYLRPGPGYRGAVDHGLFGTLTVEPAGSEYLDASIDGKPLLSGWEAIIAPKNAPSFREAVKMHHEIGNDNETVADKNGAQVPLVDSTTGSYRPGAFALNYRSEPFRNRLLTAGKEKSHSYSSYVFGDPATPMPRGYVGDPTKFRIVHAGGEKFHVYHLHGGGDRWRYSPVADTTYHYADTQLQKHPKTMDSPSNRLDAQSIGPGESYNLEIEGGAGGVQHSVGDLLFHCHIAKHYVSGMWSFWRVYDTLQPQTLKQDALAVLPDRVAHPEAVDSVGLLGRTMPDGTKLDTPQKLDDWIRPQLPPAGDRKANTQDPSVWNWKIDDSDAAKPVYFGEPEDTASPARFPDLRTEVAGHPGLLPIDLVDANNQPRSLSNDGNRPRLLFNPDSGRPAYPLLRTHAGTRPPFSGNGHTGSPFLGESGDLKPKAGVVNPFAARPDGLCPRTKSDQKTPTPIRHFNITSIGTAVQRSKTVTDLEGKLFVLAGTQDAVRAKPAEATPLAIRANVGDCARVTLTNEMPDSDAFDGWSKNTIHIHHVQFDVQGSDGVSTGFAYEHSVRPYKQPAAQTKATDMDPTLTASTQAGDTTLRLSDVRKFVGTDANGNPSHPFIAIGEGTNGIEIRQIKTVTVTNAATGAGQVTVDPLGPGPLAPGDKACDQPTGPTCTDNAETGVHAAGESAGIEFIQYEWYADVLLDNIFWHDHVDGIHGWGHGLVGQLIVEPDGSTYHDPATGARLDSGTIADIRVDTSSPMYTPVAKGVNSFRELALWQIDDNDRGDYSTLNLKAAPFTERPDAANRFSSYTYGDPLTPMPRAYSGDPVVVRSINVGPSMDTLHFQGQRFRNEFRYHDSQGNPEGTLIDTIHNGMSEKYTIVLDGSPGTTDKPGDYLYEMADARRTAQGAWGIVRVLDGADDTLKPLPGNAPSGDASVPHVTGSAPPATSSAGNPCPGTAKVNTFNVSAVDLLDTGRGGTRPNGTATVAYVDTKDVAAARSGAITPPPLVLHVAAGDCLVVKFRNDRSAAIDPVTGLPLPIPRASFSAGKLLRDPSSSGINVGFTSEQTAGAGETVTYRYYADNAQIGSAVVGDMAADEAVGTKRGLYGAIVVGPQNATFTDPVTHLPVDRGVAVDVHVPDKDSYRDFTTILADDEMKIGQDFMPYPTDAKYGAAGINYRAAPAGDGPNAFAMSNPGTPILTSYAGDPVLVHQVSAPGSEQAHVFSLGGLMAPRDRFVHDSELTTNQSIGPWESFDAEIAGGAGGWSHSIGDFFYGDLRRPFTQIGVWGLQRVLPPPATCPVAGAGLACLTTAPVVTPPVVTPSGDTETPAGDTPAGGSQSGSRSPEATPPGATPGNGEQHAGSEPAKRPGAPVIGTPRRGDRSATVRWSAPSSNGGSQVTAYRVDAFLGVTLHSTVSVASSQTSALVAGLRNGSTYTFQVTAVNAVGMGAPSARSASVVPAAVPKAPKVRAALSGVKGGKVTATVWWRPPSDTGGVRITGYQVLAQRVNAKGKVTGTTTSVRLSPRSQSYAMKLRAGSYQFRVVALNSVGKSPMSSASKRVAAR